MAEIEIYTTRYCPYCVAAKRLLTGKGLAFTEIDVSGDTKRRADMIVRANGRMTVPQIFFGATHVGGYDELYSLEQSGRLDRPHETPQHERRGDDGYPPADANQEPSG